MKRVLLISLIVVLLLAVPLLAQAAPPTNPDLSVSGCTILLSFNASADGNSYNFEVWDDGVIIWEQTKVAAMAGDLVFFSAPFDPASFDTGAPGVALAISENGSYVWIVDPWNELGDCEYGMGPDMIALPSQAVVGRFVATTTVLYNPDAAATTDIAIEAGKTLWVLGVDSSGGFYKVLISGQAFWVPVSSMGPNFDDVWNGTPLPTTVVS